MTKKKDNQKKISLKPNKLLGQNFLIDKNIIKKIINAAQIEPEDIILEIGPGKGKLTRQLIKKAKKVIAVEKDPRLTNFLKQEFQNEKKLKIIEADILKFLKSWAEKKYKVVANIPYYLTSCLIRLLLESSNPPKKIILLIQKEVAQRICAKPPSMSLLAVSVQFYAQTEIIAYVKRQAFWPQPKVDSAIIKITPLAKKYSENFISNFFSLVKAGFSQPRKQLKNNLYQKLKINREKILASLAQIGINPEQRAETLSLEKWLILTDKLFQ